MFQRSILNPVEAFMPARPQQGAASHRTAHAGALRRDALKPEKPAFADFLKDGSPPRAASAGRRPDAQKGAAEHRPSHMSGDAAQKPPPQAEQAENAEARSSGDEPRETPRNAAGESEASAGHRQGVDSNNAEGECAFDQSAALAASPAILVDGAALPAMSSDTDAPEAAQPEAAANPPDGAGGSAPSVQAGLEQSGPGPCGQTDKRHAMVVASTAPSAGKVPPLEKQETASDGKANPVDKPPAQTPASGAEAARPFAPDINARLVEPPLAAQPPAPEITLQTAAPAMDASAPAPPPASARAVPLTDLPMVISTLRGQDNHHFEIRLDPVELGRVDITLDVGKDGKVSAHLIVERPETLQLLRQDAQTLQNSLGDPGERGEPASVSMSLRDDRRSDGGGQQREQSPSPSSLQAQGDTPRQVASPRRSFGPAKALDITL